jgi:hypothetical protein
MGKWAGPLPPITQQRPLIARYAWPVGAALAKPRDCIDDRISNGRRNETRSLSLMSAVWVKSGTAKQKDRPSVDRAQGI